MKAGEVGLAVHPNCGTNFVTAGIAAGLAAYVGFLGANSGGARRERLPLVAMLATGALILAQPFGLELQRHITTSGEMRGLEITRIERNERGKLIRALCDHGGLAPRPAPGCRPAFFCCTAQTNSPAPNSWRR